MAEAHQPVIVDWYALVVVGVACVLTRCLHRLATPLCPLLVRLTVPKPATVSQLQRELVDLVKEQQNTSMVDNFTVHARLQRRVNHKKQELEKLEGQYQSLQRKRRLFITGGSFLAIELLRVIVVIVHRHLPVLLLPSDALWPLSPVLRFPTGIPGAIGVPVWAILCHQVIGTSLMLWTAVWS